MSSERVSKTARAVAQALEPVIGQVYFAPECHDGYAALGFGPSPGFAGSTALPDGPAYFCSRGSVMGQVPGEVIAAAFAVFNPAAVLPAVNHGWSLTEAPTICAARDAGAIAQLHRVLGDKPAGLARVRAFLERATAPLRPEGRPLYSGLRSLPMPDDELGRMWRHGDMLREYRGDCHTAAWIGEGLDATEIGLLTDLWYGLPMRSYSATRAWSTADFDAAQDRLQSRGLIDSGALTGALTEDGRTLRERIEATTDTQLRSVVAALDDDVDELLTLLKPWGTALRDAGAYLASGPGDLARKQ
jgi:hypothetical protein